MSVPYELFTNAFLSKITEFDLLELDDDVRTEIIDGYMYIAMSNSNFKKVCKYDFSANKNEEERVFNVSVPDELIDEIADIVSEGMVVQWLKPYVYKQELLENAINTKDFTTYSPAELLNRIKDTYTKAQKDYLNMIREYSYNHGDLTDLHL